MNQKALLIAGCIAATAPTISVADVLPENLVGLNLGEIRSSSFLNQPFKGVIPFLFTSLENSKNLSVKLAPESIFNKIGAEKHPILNSLNFQVTNQNNKPVILISSNKPIQLPFLNFVLEIQGPTGVVYQDYTVLLDLEDLKQEELIGTNYLDFNSQASESEILLSQIEKSADEPSLISEATRQLEESGTLLLANLASRTISTSRTSLKYRVKSGDSLSKIAQKHGTNNASINTMSLLIYQKNSRAFIRGDRNRIKKGAVINLPTASEIQGFEIANNKNKVNIKPIKKLDTNIAEESLTESNKEQSSILERTIYTVAKGDSLTKITKKFATKNTSYTKLMSAIYTSNPEAFVNKNLINMGAEISIPDLSFNPEERLVEKQQPVIKKEVVTTSPLLKPSINTDQRIVSETKKSEIIVPVVNNKAESTDLIKRIRELRKELKQAKSSLSKMEKNLNNKELLLNQRNLQVESLNTAFLKLKGDADLGMVPATVVKTAIEKNTKIVKKENSKDNYKPISKAEMAKRKHDLLQKKLKTEILLKKADEIKSKLAVHENVNTGVGNTNESNQKFAALSLIDNMSKANLAYLTAALLLGLLLIRYRRRIYYFTYSAINYDQPNYYSVPEASYDLKEKNINYHDPKMDEDPSNYEFMSTEPEVVVEQEQELDTNSDISKVEINPLLVEATEDIFVADKEIDVNEEIEQCEDLVTELLDGLKINEDSRDDTEWNGIEKVCDNYLDKVKSTDNENGALVDGATDFNHMMSDLLESLDKVDERVKKGNLDAKSFPDLLKFNKPQTKVD